MTTEHEALTLRSHPAPWAVYEGTLRPHFPARIIEVHDADGGVVIPWPAFDDSDHSRAAHRRRARLIVSSVNARAQVDEDVRRLVEAAAPFANISSCYCEDYWQDYGRQHGPNCVVDDLSPDIAALRAALEPFKAVGATDDR